MHSDKQFEFNIIFVINFPNNLSNVQNLTEVSREHVANKKGLSG